MQWDSVRFCKILYYSWNAMEFQNSILNISWRKDEKDDQMIVIPWFSYFSKQSLSRSNIETLDRIKSFISHQVLWNGKCIVSADHHINYCSLNCEWIIHPFISLTIDSLAYHHNIWNLRTFSPIIIRNLINYSLIIMTIHYAFHSI